MEQSFWPRFSLWEELNFSFSNNIGIFRRSVCFGFQSVLYWDMLCIWILNKISTNAFVYVTIQMKIKNILWSWKVTLCLFQSLSLVPVLCIKQKYFASFTQHPVLEISVFSLISILFILCMHVWMYLCIICGTVDWTHRA